MLLVGENRQASATATPVISGTPQSGEVLTVSAAGWSRYGTITRQWYRDGVAISGETGTTYTTVVGDIGANLTVVETNTSDTGATKQQTSPQFFIEAATSPAPVVANQTLTFGDWNYSACPGGVYPVNTGGDIIAAEITAGNAAGHWAIANDGKIYCVAPLVGGVPAMVGSFGAAAYTLTCSFTGSAGSPLTGVTITIDLDQDTAYVSESLSGIDAIMSVFTSKFVANGTGTNIYTKIRPGTYTDGTNGTGAGFDYSTLSNKRWGGTTYRMHIQAADPSDKPVMSGVSWRLQDSTGFTLKNIRFEYVSGGYSGYMVIMTPGTFNPNNMVIDGCEFIGNSTVDYTTIDAYFSTAFGTCSGITVQNGANLTVQNCYFEHMFNVMGIEIYGDTLVKNNTIYNTYVDAIKVNEFGGASGRRAHETGDNIIIEENFIYGFFGRDGDKNTVGLHSDGIQWVTVAAPYLGISSMSRTSNVTTVTTSADHGLTSGDYVSFLSFTDTSINNDYAQVTVTGTNTFTYANTGSDGSLSTAGGLLRNTQAMIPDGGVIIRKNVLVQTYTRSRSLQGIFFQAPSQGTEVYNNIVVVNASHGISLQLSDSDVLECNTVIFSGPGLESTAFGSPVRLGYVDYGYYNNGNQLFRRNAFHSLTEAYSPSVPASTSENGQFLPVNTLPTTADFVGPTFTWSPNLTTTKQNIIDAYTPVASGRCDVNGDQTVWAGALKSDGSWNDRPV